ncbi:Protein F13E6.2 [Aphelenchoides avenae]|nr:Protein F13E6.2 [Aphelenchus avenae]
MGAEAKRYLQEHSIPQLFEGLMTGLIYNKPDDPIHFLEGALVRIRKNPDLVLRWDSFIDGDNGPGASGAVNHVQRSGGPAVGAGGSNNRGNNNTRASSPKTKKKAESKRSPSPKPSPKAKAGASKQGSRLNTSRSPSPRSRHSSAGSGDMVNNRNHRIPSVAKDAEFAKISPDAPIVLFMGTQEAPNPTGHYSLGGPGGGKTRHAARIRDALSDRGLVHVCMPDLIRNAINKYKDHHAEWKDAAERYARGELISNNLTQDLVKAEMGKHPFAKVYFLEGFPREARQVEDFERNIRPVNMAMILDYDEDTLRSHMHNRGLSQDVINRRINEFKNKTLPSAKYFDDQRLLHLIPGEKDDNVIFDRMKKLVLRAMESGVPVYNSNPPSGAPTPQMVGTGKN